MTLSNLAHFDNFELSFIGLANNGNVLATFAASSGASGLV
jgi:hypothetical protein